MCVRLGVWVDLDANPKLGVANLGRLGRYNSPQSSNEKVLVTIWGGGTAYDLS